MILFSISDCLHPFGVKNIQFVHLKTLVWKTNKTVLSVHVSQ